MEEELSVETDGDLRIVADPGRLDRVLWNLLSNAEKYGKPPFEVHAWQDQDSPVVHLAVRDHGSGLDAAQRAQAFDEFATSDDVAGVGLGLAIVRQLVSAHGGSVRYEDADPGARFVVTLPAHGPPPLGAE
jgi:signal transduction histidine kinase